MPVISVGWIFNLFWSNAQADLIEESLNSTIHGEIDVSKCMVELNF